METSSRGESIRAFLAGWISKKYDPVTDLQFSGVTLAVMEAINAGQALVRSIDVLYEAGQPKQVHAVLTGSDAGNLIDVYLKNRALHDYLNIDLRGEGSHS